jgi:hypothetical protein
VVAINTANLPADIWQCSNDEMLNRCILVKANPCGSLRYRFDLEKNVNVIHKRMELLANIFDVGYANNAHLLLIPNISPDSAKYKHLSMASRALLPSR